MGILQHFQVAAFCCLQPHKCLSSRHSRSGGHTAALPGGLRSLQPSTSLGSRHNHSGEQTAALPGGLRRLQPSTCLSPRHSLGAAPISASPGVYCMLQLHRCPHSSGSPAPMPTGALPSGPLGQLHCRCLGPNNLQGSGPAGAHTAALPSVHCVRQLHRRSKSASGGPDPAATGRQPGNLLLLLFWMPHAETYLLGGQNTGTAEPLLWRRSHTCKSTHEAYETVVPSLSHRRGHTCMQCFDQHSLVQ